MSEESKEGLNLNLSGIEAPQSNQNSNYAPSVPFGIGVFTINNVTQGESTKKKTPFLEVTFNSSEGVPFLERFYVTPKALTRIKELFINSGVSEEKHIKKLEGSEGGDSEEPTNVLPWDK